MLIATPALARKPKAPTPTGNPASWFTAADYPPAARRAMQQGRVEIEVSVDADGQITGCQILTSSGSAALDQGTCDVVRKRGRFNPATDNKGNRVAGTYSLGTRWVLEGDARLIPRNQPWYIASIISVDSAGKVLTCKENNSAAGVWTPYPCASVGTLPVWYALYTRTGVSGSAPIDVTFEGAVGATGSTPTGMVSATPGRTVLAAMVLRLDVGIDGQVTGCKVIRDSGTTGWTDPCKRKIGPFAASDKPSTLDMTLTVSRAGG